MFKWLESLVLQRLLTFSFAPLEFFSSSLFVAQFGQFVSCCSPLAPEDEFFECPVSNVEQVFEDVANFGHADVKVFFPPAVVFATLRTAGPASTGRCDDASPSSLGFHIHQDHIHLCP